MNNNIATNNGTNEENNTFFSVWVILRGWIAATILVLICVIAGVALSARSLNDFPYPHPGYTGSNSEAYPDTKDYGGMLNDGVDPPTSSPSWIQSYTHQGMYSNGTHANVFTAATVLTNSDPTLLFTNNDDDHNDNGSNQENNDDGEIKYIAVIGWYAIMIGLVFCVVPILMAIPYQRRIRRAENNARDEMQTNIRVIQNRRNDIEAQQQQQQQQQHQRHNSYHLQDDDNVTTFLTATENHDCTWDYLEGLFAATTTTPAVTPRNSANNDAAFIGNNGSHGLVGRRRHMMTDILLEVSAIDFIRGHVERELAKRRDCRRRLLAALKLYSMKISECHLISISDDEEGEDGGGGGKLRLLTTPRRDDNKEGHVKSVSTAPMNGNTSYDSNNGESYIVDDIVNVGCDNVNDEVVVNKMASSETDEIVVSEGAKINTNINDNTISNLGAAETEEDGVSNSQQLNKEIGQCSQLADVVSKSPQLMSLPSFNSRKDSPHVVVNHVNGTDIVDDDDNNYSALLIPCTSTTPSSSENLTRTVIPTCAICLVQYKPGNYVTWSSNDECCHAFHRDCILIWLLKKDASNVRSRRNGGSNDGEDGEFGGSKYLCPCCRGEFVSNTLLKEIVDATTASSTPTTAI